MSYCSTTPGSICRQSSQFLLLPTELRRAIYAQLVPPRVHLSLRQGKLLFSTCIEAGSSDDDGSERKSSGDMRTDDTWACRLQSLWGTHWECEETINENTFPEIISVILACKTIYNDVFTFMSDHVHFNLASLDTLDYLTRDAGSFFLSSLSQSIARLNLCLRFPARLCQAIENLGPDKKPLALNTSCASQLSAWLWFPNTITRFSKLRKICIQLDHDNPSSWANTNERALVSPILPLAHIKGLDLSVVLPRLHPEYQDFGWQYSPSSAAPEFTLHRRQRQKYYAERHVFLTRVGVIRDSPFPMYAELARADEELPEFADMTVADMASFERDVWAAGKDLESELFWHVGMDIGYI